MSIVKKHVMNLRKSVQGYYNSYQAAQERVTVAEQELEEAQAEERDVKRQNRERIFKEMAEHNTKAKRLAVQVAQDEVKRIESTRFGLLDRAAQIRKELSAELDETLAADPAQVDANTMTLLNSGILRATDYESMYNKAKASGNATMCRLIGKAAGDYAKKVDDVSTRRNLNVIYNDSVSAKRDAMTNYDEYVYMLSTATGNPESVYRYRSNPGMFEFFLNETADIEESED